jgi:hypothetical protein
VGPAEVAAGVRAFVHREYENDVMTIVTKLLERNRWDGAATDERQFKTGARTSPIAALFQRTERDFRARVHDT